MEKYIIRLDDACEKRDVKKWDQMEQILDKYGVKPLVGVIPHCEDPMIINMKKILSFGNVLFHGFLRMDNSDAWL